MKATCYRFSGLAGLGYLPLEATQVNGRGGRTGRLLFRGLTAEGCWLERVGNKGGDDGWNVKPRPSRAELPFCSGVSLKVSRSLLAKSDLGIKI